MSLCFRKAVKAPFREECFDQCGGVVAGATVTVIDVARGVTRDLIADDAGAVCGCQPESRHLYGPRQRQRLPNGGAQRSAGGGGSKHSRGSYVLQTGEQTQTITVTGEVPAIDSTDATLGGTVSNESILALPLNGRNFLRLLQLRPGVMIRVGPAQGHRSTNGRRAGDDLLLVEGIIEVNGSQAATIMNQVYQRRRFQPPRAHRCHSGIHTTQNPKAEYGWKDGSVMNVGIKSGTNGLHGTAYAFGRDSRATDAANYFHRGSHAGNLGAVRRVSRRTHHQRQAFLVCELRGSARDRGKRYVTASEPDVVAGTESLEHGRCV